MRHPRLRILFIGDSVATSAQPLAADSLHPLSGDNGRWQVETATHRAELLDKLNDPPYDLVLADGFCDLSLADIRQLVHERWSDTPVIPLQSRGATGPELAKDGLQHELEALRAELSRAERQRTFNAAAAAILRARTPQEVYSTVASELIGLGLYAHILELEPDGQHLSIAHVAFPPSILRALIHIVGKRVLERHFPLSSLPNCATALAERRTIFVAEPQLPLETLLGSAARRVRPLLQGQDAMIAPLSRQSVGAQLIAPLHGLLVVTGQLTPDDAPAISALAEQISTALENAQLYEEARRRADHMRLVNEVGRDIALVLDGDELLQTVVTHVKRAFGYYNVAVGLIEGAVVAFRRGNEVVSRVPLGQGIIGWVAQTGEPLLVPDVATEPRFLYYPPLPDTRAELAVPILIQSQPIGVLDVQSDQVGGLDAHDLEVMQALAGQLAAAIQNTRLLRERDQRLQDVAALLATSETLARTLDAQAAMTHVAELMVQLLQVDACAISAYDEAADTITALVQHGHQAEPGDLNVAYNLRDYPATAECLRTGQPFVVHADDPAGDPAEQALLRDRGASTLLAVPLTVGGRTIGLAELYSLSRREFQPQEISLCQHLAVQAGVAMDNARLYEQVSRRAEEVSALLTSAAVITSSYALRDRLEAIAKQAIDLVKAEGGTIYLLDEDGVSLQPLVSLEDYAEAVLATPLRVGEGITGYVARSGVGEIVNDVLEDPRAFQIPGTPREKECLLAVPLAVQGKVIGVMSLIRKGGPGFMPQDLELLTSLAHHAAIAIKNARLLEEARHQAEQLHALYTVAATAGRSLELGEMLDAVLAEVLHATGMEVAFIHLTEEEGRLQAATLGSNLRLAAQRGTSKLAVHGARMRLAEGILERAAATGRTQVAAAEEQGTAAGEQGSRGAGGNARSPAAVVAVPLSAKGRTVGVLSVGGAGKLSLADEQVQLLEAIAQQVAVAIENAQLYQALRQRAESLERAYAELAEADKLKDELIQNVSHELRTPLTFVKGYADLLANGDLGPLLPEQLEAAEIMATKANVLVRLIGDIVSLHAVSPSTLVPQLISLVELAESVIANLEPEKLLAEAGIRIRCDFAPDVPLVRADPERMAQVFENLLSNAIKFSPDGGQITVHIWPEDALVYVAISDTGIGIPPDKLARVFERFYQVDGSTTRRFGGAGLGLTLCKQIVEAHGGDIYVESEVGQGSTFWFTLMAASE